MGPFAGVVQFQANGLENTRSIHSQCDSVRNNPPTVNAATVKGTSFFYYYSLTVTTDSGT